ncbi:cytochrome P450 [Actinophytocola algeriensis]|uniref:Cytochrome P450 n=1 Tax=Actinophytocola algeriensis TaxID=1768010 RepID=A0A7W7Q1W9_9PSEU|nr:cytochrome P450 [Actinophytocola algeriensis]MBB4905495.1 cytochrome P450 [Actinophytocola algeriensis]MBE1472820.1 cytochrome P450 [Actinophytocola algeriensis]
MATTRKIDRAAKETVCPAFRDAEGVWHVRDLAGGRALLRDTETVQAGLGVETVEKLPSGFRRPVLYWDGPEHREYRRQTARFFTPRRVDEEYRDLMHRVADREIGVLRAAGRADLSELSFRLAVDVAKAVVGLTESRPGTARRLARFFPEELGTPGFTSPRGVYWAARILYLWLAIYVSDVRPAVRVRRRQREDDLISHLLDEGAGAGEILSECITVAAAGMVTTREFICAAAWHLFTDDALLTAYRAGDEQARFAVLHEVARLEPPLAEIKRRTTAPVTLPDGTVIAEDERVDVSIAAANLDQAVAPGLTFGDGPHRCPGQYLAIQEADIFLTKLFAQDGVRLTAPPRVAFNDAFGSYSLHDMVVSVGDRTVET